MNTLDRDKLFFQNTLSYLWKFKSWTCAYLFQVRKKMILMLIVSVYSSFMEMFANKIVKALLLISSYAIFCLSPNLKKAVK